MRKIILLILLFLLTNYSIELKAQKNILLDTANVFFLDFPEIQLLLNKNIGIVKGLSNIEPKEEMFFNDFIKYYLIGLNIKRKVYQTTEEYLLPKNYCDCIDTSIIKENKNGFFEEFEEKILKSKLENLKLLEDREYEMYFNSFFDKSLKRTRYFTKIGKEVFYPTNPLCELLKDFLKIRNDIETKKEILAKLSSELNLNNEKVNLKYRVWVDATFSKNKLLEIYSTKNELGGKAIIHTFDSHGWAEINDREIKIIKSEVIEINNLSWNFFWEKTELFNLTNQITQSYCTGLNNYFTTTDGHEVIVEVYEKGEVINFLDYYSSFDRGCEQTKNFKDFFDLTTQIFKWKPLIN